jgi:acyl dehydratase
MTEILPPELQAFIGAEATPEIVMRDPIEMSAIRRWCDAMGDANPLYVDEDYARATEFGGRVAPPAMLDAWTMPFYDPDRKTAGDHMPVMAALTALGYPAAVATNIEQEYFRYLKPGDTLTCRSIVESISAEKTTSLGRGRFIYVRNDYIDQTGEPVGLMRMGMFKFEPAGRE